MVITRESPADVIDGQQRCITLFMLLAALSLLMLRHTDSQRARPFRVPLYPLNPLLFAATCLGLLWSSTLYAGPGAIVGLVVLVAGAPLLLLRKKPLAAKDLTL
jgi:amino acid transporter